MGRAGETSNFFSLEKIPKLNLFTASFKIALSARGEILNSSDILVCLRSFFTANSILIFSALIALDKHFSARYIWH